MKKATLGRHLVGYFLAGVYAILPLVITVLVVVWVASFLQGLLGPETVLGGALSRLGLRFVRNSVVAYGVGWMLVLVGIFVLGFLVQRGAKRLFQTLVDGILRRVPLVGKVYDASRQLIDMVDQSGSSELKGMMVVFCFFGKETGAGVLALMPTAEKIPIEGRDYNVVLVPQAPVPFGGALMFVPAESVKRVNMSVDALMSIYVSMGATCPKVVQDELGGRPKPVG